MRNFGKLEVPILSSLPTPFQGVLVFSGGKLWYGDGAAWKEVGVAGAPAGSVTVPAFEVGHTVVIPDAIAVASGDTNYLPPFVVPGATGQIRKLTKVYTICRSGSAVVQILNNGAQVTGLTNVAVGQALNTVTLATPLTLGAGALLAVNVVSSSSGMNASITLAVEHSFA